jgi:myosin heavy subunit
MAGGHRSVHESNMTAPMAEMCRDVLCKEVFEALFWWLVDRINARERLVGEVTEGEGALRTLNVVDAFGFENLKENNKVEQLCVNYINDLVFGRYFRREVLLKEQEAYREQGIQWQVGR